MMHGCCSCVGVAGVAHGCCTCVGIAGVAQTCCSCMDGIACVAGAGCRMWLMLGHCSRVLLTHVAHTLLMHGCCSCMEVAHAWMLLMHGCCSCMLLMHGCPACGGGGTGGHQGLGAAAGLVAAWAEVAQAGTPLAVEGQTACASGCRLACLGPLPGERGATVGLACLGPLPGERGATAAVLSQQAVLHQRRQCPPAASFSACMHVAKPTLTQRVHARGTDKAEHASLCWAASPCACPKSCPERPKGR